MKILGNVERGCRRGPEVWFSGEVWLDMVNKPEAPSRMEAVLVTFTPGARTAWHTHPMGQALHVLTGVGRVQLAGKPAQIITAGDSVWIEAGERHWHGADAGHTMVHLAIQEADQNGVNVVWLEHVSEEDYSAPVERS